MKKIYTAIILFSFLLAFGCSKDFLKSYDRRIIGSWRIADINKTGFGGDTGDLPFQEGQFTFHEDGTLNYVNAAGTTYQGTWNIEKKNYDETVYKSLEITVVNFTNQQVLGEYYDEINFTSTDHFKARINSGLHTYITHFRRS
jgi:hypothetical protein